jgi:hypothetical protein
MPYNDLGKNSALTGGLGNAITHIGLLQDGDPGTGTNFTGTEATGGSPAYARVAVTWGTAATGQRSNSGALLIDVAPGTYSDFLFCNASTGNTANYLGYAPINGSVKGYGVVPDAAAVTANLIYSSAHGLSSGHQLRVYNVFAESLPTGLTEGTRYFVIATGLTTDAFSVSTTLGGSAVDITAVGDLFFQRVIPETFAAQGQVSLAIAALVLDATAM